MAVIKNLNKIDIIIRAESPSELSFKIYQFQLLNDMMTGDNPFMQSQDGNWYKTFKVNLEEVTDITMLEEDLKEFFGGVNE